MVANLSEPLVVQYNLGWMVVFPIFLSWNLSRKKPCSTSSSEKMCLRCFQLDAGILWSFKSFQGYVHICTIESSTILKRPSGRLDWCTHKRAQRSCKTCKHKNYCRSIRRKENLKVINSRNLVGLFKATSIFLTSMEEVILLGLSGSTKSSLTWSSGGNTFSFCLNKDFGGTFGWKLNVDFFLAGLLEVGELLWHLYTLSTWVPRSVISLCSLSVWSAFSLKTLSPSKNFSNLSNSLLDFMHKTDEAVLSLLTGNPSTDDNFAAIFCSLERTPSNKLNFPYPGIIYQNLHYTLCKNYLHYIYTLFTDVNLFTGVIETLLTKFAIPQFDSITRCFMHHCPTCRHVKLRKQTDPTKNRFGKLSCFKIAWKWGS